MVKTHTTHGVIPDVQSGEMFTQLSKHANRKGGGNASYTRLGLMLKEMKLVGLEKKSFGTFV